jgi:hypothetical protein
MTSPSHCAPTGQNLSLIAFQASLSTAGLLCCIQTFILVGITFRRWSGLYFWSLVGAAFSLLLCCLAIPLRSYILKETQLAIPAAMTAIGYLFFPPFSFLLLYSRLHLLQASKRILKLVFIVIAIEWLVAEVPQAVLTLLNFRHPGSERIASLYKVSWELEEALYPVVDLLLCSMYLIYVKSMWNTREPKVKRVLRHVAIMIIFLILIDVSILTVQNVVAWDWANAIIV